ncbi:Putative Small nuclear ribonucleoprotein [Rhizopus microsporus]|nr:Putative Small nuclear ribonucleoprotein [Rhizopus microsporus]
MSERGGRGQYSNRGGDRGGRGGGCGGSRGGRGGYHNASQEKPKKESILDLSKYMEKKIRVRFNGGREVVGTLMGYDPLLNLVLDHTVEYQRDLETGYVTENTRELGLSVLRGTAIILISPFDGMEEIENPFAQ